MENKSYFKNRNETDSANFHKEKLTMVPPPFLGGELSEKLTFYEQFPLRFPIYLNQITDFHDRSPSILGR